MNRKHYDTSAFTAQDAKRVLQDVWADKQKIQSYISVHGSLEGFKDERIVFAKPL